MPDQLSLQLPVRAPGLPPTMRPMRARLAQRAFDSPDFLFEPAWGGLRVLAYVDGGAERDRPGIVRFLDEDGRDVTATLPELAELPRFIGADTAILDGEIVIVDRAGRNDRLALAARLRGAPGPSAAFLAFDVPYLDGRPLLSMPLERRRDRLRRVLVAGGPAVAVPCVVGDGIALFTAAVDVGIAGVMGRVRRSPYLPGVRSRLWQLVSAAGAAGERDHAGTALPGERTSEASEAGEAADTSRGSNADRTAPMLALIRRLPFDDPD